MYEAKRGFITKKQRGQLFILLLIIVGIGVVIYTSLASKSNEASIVGVGDGIPHIELLDMSGQPVVINTEDSRPMLINLWASWCKPCINELPLLNEAQAFAPDVDFIAINMEEAIDKITPMIERYDLTMTVLRDEHLAWKRALAVQGYPVSLIVDQRGNIIHIHRGAYTAIEEIMEQLTMVAGSFH